MPNDRLPDGKTYAEEAYSSIVVVTYALAATVIVVLSVGVLAWRALG